MKRVAVVLLAGALMLPSPALGAEVSGFSDVEAGSWYAEGVRVCVEAGLMEGVGEGRFAPGDRLSQPECLTLALRLYDLCHGGDGVLPPAPEDWDLGEFSLELDDGTVLTAAVSDPEAVNFQPTGLFFYLEDGQAGWGSGKEGTEAVLRYQGKTYSAVLQFWGGGGDGKAALIFPEEYGKPFYELYEALSERSAAVPSRDAWYRDAWYYLEANGLSDRFYFRYEDGVAASREQFALALAESGAEWEAVNAVTSLPDTADERVLALYNAGVLTGTDGYGRFGGESGLTRAEAAVMAARVLEPGQRRAFTLDKPATVKEYSLTYLMDGWPDCGVTYPVCVLANENASGVLTLDGRLLPWPGVTPSFGLARDGEYCYFSVWREADGETVYDMRGMKTGLMDRDGNFPVPMGAYDQLHSTGDGHLIAARTDDPYDPNSPTRWYLLSPDGTVETALPDPAEMPADDDGSSSWYGFNEGVCPWKDPESGLWGYVDAAGAWAAAPTWESAGGFEDGYAVVRLGGLYGAIDRSGALAVPYAYPSLDYVGGGRFFSRDWQSRTNRLVLPGGGAWEVYSDEYAGVRVQNGYVPCPWGTAEDGTGYLYCYLDEALNPVTPAEFTFAGDIGPDGSGFVGKDGKIYRIQFEP